MGVEDGGYHPQGRSRRVSDMQATVLDVDKTGFREDFAGCEFSVETIRRTSMSVGDPDQINRKVTHQRLDHIRTQTIFRGQRVAALYRQASANNIPRPRAGLSDVLNKPLWKSRN